MMKLYQYGKFDREKTEGKHDRLGELRCEIVVSVINSLGYDRLVSCERYFFETDTTNGQGIDRRNVLAYFTQG